MPSSVYIVLPRSKKSVAHCCVSPKIIHEDVTCDSCVPWSCADLTDKDWGHVAVLQSFLSVLGFLRYFGVRFMQFSNFIYYLKLCFGFQNSCIWTVVTAEIASTNTHNSIVEDYN